MKSLLYLFIVATSLLFYSCGEGDNPALSRTELLSRTWIFDEIVHTSVTNGNVRTEVQDVTNSDYEQEYFSDGTLEIRNDGNTLSGTWSFVNDYTLHTTFDFDPGTVYSSVIIELTENRFVITNTSTIVQNGIQTVTVSEIIHTAK